MNATIITTKTNASTQRIRVLSQILKALVLIYMVVIPLVCLISPVLLNFVTVNFILQPGQTMGPDPRYAPSNPPTISMNTKMATALSAALYLMGAMMFYRLLNLYERGVVFSPANVRLFRWLGILAFCKGLLTVVASSTSYGDFVFPMVLFSALRSTWVIGAIFAITLSFIMDEGCKLREEQELTV